jgi:hypothetical protein
VSLKLKIGASYSLTNASAISISRSERRDSTGRKIGYTERWEVTGWLSAATPTLLTTAIDALKAACLDGSDVGLYESGSPDVATSHILTNSLTVGGTRLEGPKFPEGQGAQYANQRTFTLTVEADFDAAGIAGTLTSFQETVSVTGTGGARFVTQTPLDGPVIAQTVSRFSPIMVVQSGSAIGHTAYPTVPAPLLSIGEHADRRQVSCKGPERQANGTYRGYEVNWSYEFEIPGGAVPVPHAWGA